MSESSVIDFYLPPGLLCSSHLLGIICCLDSKNSSSQSLNISVESQNYSIQSEAMVFNHLEKKFYTHVWHLLEPLPSSNIIILKHGSDQIAFNFDEMIPISLSSQLDHSFLTNFMKSFVFQFQFGYFGLKKDFPIVKISPSLSSIIPKKSILDYKKSCHSVIRLSEEMSRSYKSNFQLLFDEFKQQHQKVVQKRKDFYEKQQQWTFPTMNPIYIDDRFDQNNIVDDSDQSLLFDYITHRPRAKTFTAKTMISKPVIQRSHSQHFNNFQKTLDDHDSKNPNLHIIETDDNFINSKWPSPNKEQIKVFLKEICEVFPITKNRTVFCGCLNGDSMFTFNVLHFLVTFSQITGTTYDYRIRMKNGQWRIQDRCTGKEIPSSNFQNVIHHCLDKILNDMNIQPENRTTIQKLDLIESTYKSL